MISLNVCLNDVKVFQNQMKPIYEIWKQPINTKSTFLKTWNMCSRTFLVILDTLIYHCSFDTLVDIKQKQSSKQSTSFRSAWFITCSVHSRILPFCPLS